MGKIIRDLYVLFLIAGPTITVVFYIYFSHKRRMAGMGLGAALFCIGVWGLAQKLLKK